MKSPVFAFYERFYEWNRRSSISTNVSMNEIAGFRFYERFFEWNRRSLLFTNVSMNEIVLMILHLNSVLASWN